MPSEREPQGNPCCRHTSKACIDGGPCRIWRDGTEKPDTEPELCGDVSESGFVCTRDKGHSDHHENGHGMIWPAAPERQEPLPVNRLHESGGGYYYLADDAYAATPDLPQRPTFLVERGSGVAFLAPEDLREIADRLEQ